ncbi:MAG: phosphotransferase [Candidatus Latescibacteria bacterium]|nr:phosphotransferase [Candidatus Latescibacterota bacterium]HJP30632.1 phosphotransferase [Candidatus Latescibacterota bacterium]
MSELLGERVQRIQQHQNAEQYVVVEVNGTWIFRFIRDLADPSLGTEKAFLPLFASRSPIAIPGIEFSGRDFVGYRKIEGERLTRSLLDTFSARSRTRVAGQLAAFFTELHSFDIEEARDIGVSVGWNGWVARAHQTVRQEIAPMLSRSARRRVLDLIDQVRQETRGTTVIHADMGPANVLSDGMETGVSGVIDFGHITIEDNARDFVYLLDAYGEGFLMEVLSNYPQGDDDDLEPRIRSRRIEGKLTDAVHAREVGAGSRVERRLAEVEELLGAGP